MHPIFSIIIPTFNSEHSISNCLESILSQTFQDFEIIIMDGLSSDRTLAIIDLLNDNRIKVFSEVDSGIYDAMNKGIKNSSGSWIIFLGSDDYLFSDDVLFSLKNEILQDKTVEVIYGNVYSHRFGGIYDNEFTYTKILAKNICHQAIIYNRQVFSSIGCFNLRYQHFADWEHNFKWFLSKNINSKFVNITIAYFNDLGKSSTIGDELFNREKKYCYLLYGYKSFSSVMRFKLYKDEVKRVLNLNHKRQFLNLIIKSPRILLGV